MQIASFVSKPTKYDQQNLVRSHSLKQSPTTSIRSWNNSKRNSHTHSKCPNAPATRTNFSATTPKSSTSTPNCRKWKRNWRKRTHGSVRRRQLNYKKRFIRWGRVVWFCNRTKGRREIRNRVVWSMVRSTSRDSTNPPNCWECTESFVGDWNVEGVDDIFWICFVFWLLILVCFPQTQFNCWKGGNLLRYSLS